MRIFANERPFDLEPGARVRDAVLRMDPELQAKLNEGAVAVTDARGLPLELDAPLVAGSILRVLVRARRPGSGDADT